MRLKHSSVSQEVRWRRVETRQGVIQYLRGNGVQEGHHGNGGEPQDTDGGREWREKSWSPRRR